MLLLTSPAKNISRIISTPHVYLYHGMYHNNATTRPLLTFYALIGIKTSSAYQSGLFSLFFTLKPVGIFNFVYVLIILTQA